jgi:microsomal epoxide hydrolase
MLTLLVLSLAIASGPSHAEPVFSKAPAKDGYFKTSDGVRLHYLEAGAGDPIIFVPGWTVPAWSWDPQIRHFATGHHVIALDPRSQGESGRSDDGNYPERRARDIKELIEHEKLGRVILVGHSLAVTELLSYVEQFGTGSLAGLVLVDQDFGPYGANELISGLIRGISTKRDETMNQFAGWFFKKPLPPGYGKALLADCRKTPTSIAIALLAGRFGMDFKPTVAKLDVPVLYAITPAFLETGDWLTKTVPTARVEVFEDSGHVIYMDDADRFNSALANFASTAFAARAAR